MVDTLTFLATLQINALIELYGELRHSLIDSVDSRRHSVAANHCLLRLRRGRLSRQQHQ